MNYSKKIIPIAMISLALIANLIMAISVYIKNIRSISLSYDLDVTLVQFIQIKYYTNGFIKPVLLLFAISGLFTRHIIGWIAISIFFYYLFCEMQFSISTKTSHFEWYEYLIFLIPLFFLALLNMKMVKEHYGFPFKLIFSGNALALMIAIVLLFIVGENKLNHSVFLWEVIDKVR